MLPSKAVLLVLFGVSFAKVWYDAGHTIKSDQTVYLRCYPTSDQEDFQVIFRMFDIDKKLIVESNFLREGPKWILRLESEGANATTVPFRMSKMLDSGSSVVLMVLAEEDGLWGTAGAAGVELAVKASKNASDVRYFRVLTYGSIDFCEDPFGKCSEL